MILHDRRTGVVLVSVEVNGPTSCKIVWGSEGSACGTLAWKGEYI